MSTEQPAIDVPSTAVMFRDNQGVTRFDAQARRDALKTILNRQALVLQVMNEVMKEGVHYGKIPGCGDKPALFKAGAEKLAMVFRLTPSFTIKQIDHDKGHREYEVICTLSDGSQGVGVCSTLEGKYRFRGGARKLTDKPVPSGYWDLRKTNPAKAQEMIGKGRGTAKNEDGQWMITEPTEEKVENENPADVYNTVLKMAKKRAQVDATLTATGTSDLLTQDIEEMVDAANAASGENAAAATQSEPPKKTAKPREKKTEKAGETTGASNLPEKEAKRLFAWVDKCRDAFVTKLNEDPGLLTFAWIWAVRNGFLMPNEKLEMISATKLFASVNLNANVDANKTAMGNDYRKHMDSITAVAKEGPPKKEELEQFNKMYPPPAEEKKEPEKKTEVPRDAEAAWKTILIPSWSKHVKELGFKTFGDLPKKYLWWWCCKWEPQGYDGKPPKKEEVELRKTLDFVKENYDFESREDDSGAAPGSAEPEKPVEEDDVPF